MIAADIWKVVNHSQSIKMYGVHVESSRGSTTTAAPLFPLNFNEKKDDVLKTSPLIAIKSLPESFKGAPPDPTEIHPFLFQ